jgi:hypothetical protein
VLCLTESCSLDKTTSVTARLIDPFPLASCRAMDDVFINCPDPLFELVDLVGLSFDPDIRLLYRNKFTGPV